MTRNNFISSAKKFNKRFNIIKEKQIKIVGITDVSSGMFGIPAKLGREVLIKSLLK